MRNLTISLVLACCLLVAGCGSSHSTKKASHAATSDPRAGYFHPADAKRLNAANLVWFKAYMPSVRGKALDACYKRAHDFALAGKTKEGLACHLADADRAIAAVDGLKAEYTAVNPKVIPACARERATLIAFLGTLRGEWVTMRTGWNQYLHPGTPSIDVTAQGTKLSKLTDAYYTHNTALTKACFTKADIDAATKKLKQQQAATKK